MTVESDIQPEFVDQLSALNDQLASDTDDIGMLSAIQSGISKVLTENGGNEAMVGSRVAVGVRKRVAVYAICSGRRHGE